MKIYDVVLTHGNRNNELSFMVIANNQKESIKKARAFIKNEGFKVESPREYYSTLANFSDDGVLNI